MAILKKTVRKEVPQPLMETPTYCPEHKPGPEPQCCHHCDHPHPAPSIELHNSFKAAVLSAQRVFLRPGEARTEFYTNDGESQIHCVLAIGNIDPGQGHLILSDTGRNESIDVQLENIRKEFKKGLKDLKCDIQESLDAIDTILDLYEEQFNSINSILSLHTSSIANINVNITNLQNTIENVEKSLQATIEELKEATEQEVELINNTIVNINLHLTNIDSSIEELNKEVKDITLTPITDPSILSLFHSPFEDSYTVNLCCYTAGGHIEIKDYKADYKDRVADCTPENEYKTYNAGDRVRFSAVENEGYSFVKWLKDGRQFDIDRSIELVFTEDDINVIGTINDGNLTSDSFERAPLVNGYTALFRKRCTFSVECVVITKDAELYNDTVNVKLNDTPAPSKFYFDPGDKITINAIPGEHHKFSLIVINDVPIQGDTVTWTPDNSVYIIAYFEEIRYNMTARENIDIYGDIVSNPHMGRILEGSTIEFTAIPNPNEHTKFKKWVLDNLDAWYNDPAHRNWTSTSNPLTMIAGDHEKDWHISAVFSGREIIVNGMNHLHTSVKIDIIKNDSAVLLLSVYMNYDEATDKFYYELPSSILTYNYIYFICEGAYPGDRSRVFSGVDAMKDEYTISI